MARGRLILIATPIGNLEDITPRARAALDECDLLLCEDTRVTGKLMSALGVSGRLESFHEHNEEEKLERALELLEAGKTIGLVSDAGSPVLSDPGYPLVAAAAEAGHEIDPLPGPFAAALALAASGLPPTPAVFFGFLPRKGSERSDAFRRLRSLGMTALFYESPHRIVKSLEQLAELVPEAVVCVARELTKMHQEFLRGSAAEVAATLGSRDRVRGEITLVVGPIGEPTRELTAEALRHEFVAMRDAGMRRPDAARAIADRYGLSKREVYDRLKDLGDPSSSSKTSKR